ncbi:MAG: acyltransferase family protein [Pirellulaceae bacterium]|nr:acyltransferase family protein [Pirellulaceae bacterium]
MSGTRYRPEIDGLRALAIVPVVMFHLELGLPGGFIGVDVFFVISGFLITGIIRRGLENETFSLLEFWERRIRRILPALFVVVAATLAGGCWLLVPNQLEELGMSAVAQASLMANVYFWLAPGYFHDSAVFRPLAHTWSLALEEQFYLFFPLVLCFLRRLSHQKLFALLMTVALISFVGSAFGAFFYQEATFFLLPTRAWELLVGCLLAVCPWQCESSPRRDNAIATLGVLAIVLPFFLCDSEIPFPGLAAAPPVLGTAAVIFATANSPSIWVCKLLSLRPFVFIGLFSYSLYLWHWPVIVYTRIYFGYFGWKQIAFASVVSISLAILSWMFIETPCRQKNFVKQRRKLFTSAIILSGVTIAIGLLIIGARGFPQRFPNYPSVLVEDAEWTGDEYSLQTRFRFNSISPAELPTVGRKPSNGQEIDFLIWGDSHGMALSNCFDEIANEFNLTGKAALMHGSPPLPGVARPDLKYRLKLKREILKCIEELRPSNLILVAAWSAYEPFLAQKHFQEIITFCSKNSIRLWIVKTVPSTGEPAAAAEILKFALGSKNEVSSQKTSLADHQARTAKIEQLFRELDPDIVRFVDPAPLLFDSNQMTINYYEGRGVYRDRHHLSRWGAEQIKPLLEDMFRDKAFQNPRKLTPPSR